MTSVGISGVKQGIKDDARRLISRADKCSDEKVAVDKGITTDVIVCTTRKCSVEDQKKYGCAKGQIQPKIFFGSPSDGFVTISKCHGASKILGAISQTVDAGNGDAIIALANEAAPLGPSIPSAAPVQNAGTATLSQVLRDVKADDPSTVQRAQQALVKAGMNQYDAFAAVKAIGSGDPETANKIMAQYPNLNANLSDTSSLTPEQRAALEADPNAQPDGVTNEDGTFTQNTSGSGKASVAEATSPLCGQLGGCSDSACQSNPNKLTCWTNNPGALTWSPWEAKYGGQPCGASNNTTCFPSLEQGLAAKIGLITGSKYLGGENNTILSMICNGYSSNSAGNDCGAYATFIQNKTGIPMNQTVDVRNSEQVGKIVMAMSRYENGKFVPFTPTQLESAMSLVYGGTLPNGTPGFVPQTVYGTNGGTQFASPFNLNSSAAPATVGYGSPFANASPAPIAQSSYAPAPVQPVSQTIAQQTTTTQPQTTPGQSVADQLTQAIQGDTTSTSQSGQSIATIVTQQKTVTKGNPISVSWTSVGMSADTPCTLRAGSTVIAEKNQGTSVVPTNASTPIGSVVFTLRCTSVSGQTIQRTAATFVK